MIEGGVGLFFVFVFLDDFVGGEAVLVGVGVGVVGGVVGRLVVGAAHEAVGEFEEVVQYDKEEAE